MRLIEKKQQPAWQNAYRDLIGEAAKVGKPISNKGVSSMSKSELHEERKNLRAVCDSLRDRIRAVDLNTKEGEQDFTRLESIYHVAGDLISDIENQFDIQGAVEGHMGVRASSSAQWRTADGKAVPVLSRDERMADLPEYRDAASGAHIGFGEFICGMVGVGKPSESVRNTLSEGTDSAGGFTVPTALMAQLIDKLRAKTVLIRAGAMTVPLDTQKTSIARLASDPVAAWRSENAAVGGSDPTFEKITFTAQSLACLVKVSRELLEDSINLEQALFNAFAQAMALELDRVGMFGSGTPPEPQGFFGASINSVSMGANGGQLTSYAKVLDAIYELELDNAGPASALLMHPRTWRTIQGFVDTTGQPLLPPPALKDLAQLTTTAIPITQTQGTSGAVCSSVLSGDFTQLLFGIRSGLRIELLKERFADNLQYGFLVHLRADVQRAHDEAFVKLIGITP